MYTSRLPSYPSVKTMRIRDSAGVTTEIASREDNREPGRHGMRGETVGNRQQKGSSDDVETATMRSPSSCVCHGQSAATCAGMEGKVGHELLMEMMCQLRKGSRLASRHKRSSGHSAEVKLTRKARGEVGLVRLAQGQPESLIARAR